MIGSAMIGSAMIRSAMIRSPMLLAASLALGSLGVGEAWAAPKPQKSPVPAVVEAAPVAAAAPSEAPPNDAVTAEPTVASPSDAPTEPTTPAVAPSDAAPQESSLASAWPAPLFVQACPYTPPSLPQQTELALDATLLVETAEGFGSAVILSPDGFALTAAHVVGKSETVRLVGHGEHGLRGTVVRVDQAQDVALLKVGIAGASPCLSPIDARAPLGSDVFVLGSPAGKELSFSVAKGIVSAYRELGEARLVQLDAALNPGNSGGPAVSADGRIVGIASWKVSHVSMEGLAFAVPIDVALDALGIRLGAASSPDWAALAGRNGGVPQASEDEVPRPVVKTAPIDPALLRRRRIKTGLIVWGATLLASGVVGIGVTVGVYNQLDSMKPAGWATLQAFNTIGWGMAIGGGGLLLAGLVVRGKPKPGEVAVVPTGRGLALHGRF